MWEKAELLLLLIAANGAPILLDKVLGRRGDWPLDGGRVLADGRRLFGASATFRGVTGAVLAAGSIAALLGHSPSVGALIGLLSMVGDAVSCFVKRRLGLEPGERATGLDQVPESLLPLLAVAGPYDLGATEIGGLVLAFTVFDIVVSRLLFRLRLRKRPH